MEREEKRFEPGDPVENTGERRLWDAVAAAAFAIGFAVRLAWAYPAHKYVPDADSLNMGLRALSILRGDLVVFYSGAQIGALEAYLHAAVFLLFGASRATIALVPFLVGCLTLVFFFLLARELFGLRVAALSLLFFALPSSSYLAWTYMPNSYPETVLLCVATLWLAARIGRRGPERWTGLALGLSAGLGWWNTPLTLASTLPAVLWLPVVRRDARTLSFWKMPVAGSLAGAVPWIAYNLRYRFPSIAQVVRAPEEGNSVVLALRKLFLENIPQIAVGMDPFGAGGPLNVFQRWLEIPAVLAIFASLLLLAFRTARAGKPVRQSALLLGLVVGATASLFVFSASGTFPGPTVRYVLPLVIVFAAALGVAANAAGRRFRPAALLVTIPVLLFNVSGYYWPWTPQRRLWEANSERDSRVLRLLETNGISWICGEYWTVYPFNFLSRGRLKAVPYEPQFDFYRFGSSLPDGRMAIVATNRNVTSLAARAGVPVSVASVGPGYTVLVPIGNPLPGDSPERLYARLISAAQPRGAGRPR